MLNELKILNIITSTGRINPNISKILPKYPGIEQRIIEYTNFLKGDNISIQERVFAIDTGLTVQPTCKVCGIPLRLVREHKKYPTYCSNTCKNNCSESKQKVQASRKTTKHIWTEKIRNSHRNRTPEQKRQSKEKRLSTIQDTYGDDFINQCIQKRMKTCEDRFGVAYVSQNLEVRNQISKNHAKRLDLPDDEIIRLNHVDSLTLPEISKLYNVSVHAIHTRFIKNNQPVKIFYKSKPHRILEDLLDKMGIVYQSNVRKILSRNRELDIFITEFNIALEINGVYWHSELHGKDQYYHLDKTIECDTLGIELIHLFDIEIINHIEWVEQLLTEKLLQSSYVMSHYTFINESNNYDIWADSNNIGFISIVNDEIVKFEVTNKQYNRQHILAQFLQDFVFDRLYVILDRRFGKDSTYLTNGFVFQHNIEPNFYFFDTKRAIHIEKFTTEVDWEVLQDLGYSRIWDCGYSKYTLMSNTLTQ